MRARLANLERGLALRVAPLDGDVVDLSERGTAAAPLDHRVHSFGGAFERGLDAPVASVPHPTGESERAGPVTSLHSEEDALNLT
jgi:hypothetical protein